MKYALAFVAILVFMAGQTAGQALAPVQAEGGFWPFAIVGLLALVGVGLYLWHKRNPSQADAAIHSALTTAKDDAAALAHKVAEAMATLTKTNREQAMIIASPPVQAAINTPPAPSAPGAGQYYVPVSTLGAGGGGSAPNPIPATQIGLESTIRPAAAPTPQQPQGAPMLPDWRTFTFSPATSYFQEKFNTLQTTIGPGAAYYFMESGDPKVGATECRAELEAAWGVASGSAELKDFWRRLVNQFGGQGNPMGLSAIEVKTLARQERQYILSLFG